MVNVLLAPSIVILVVSGPLTVPQVPLHPAPLIVASAQVLKTETVAKENKNFLERD
ncbi:hypothetical protein [Campylobacter taeniopygiae]|uniref:hypothetical protein n=1 Tax=Campylobacter taeniopygiae TaxID=2510188 RepID=UPI0014854D36|nr:hypothetical protein [Campylobacter taeniopygiae]